MKYLIEKLKIIQEDKFGEIILRNPELKQNIEYFKLNGLKPKYLDWLVKQYKTQNLENSFSREEVLGFINKFDLLIIRNQLQKRDINQYKNIDDLNSSMEQISIEYNNKINKKELGKQYHVLYEDNDYKIVQPLTEEASCKFGQGTKWCISGKENNKFKAYSEEDGFKFLFVINKTTGEKDAIAYNSDHNILEIYNSEDVKVEEIQFAIDMPLNIVKEINRFMEFRGIPEINKQELNDSMNEFFTNPENFISDKVEDNEQHFDWFWSYSNTQQKFKMIDLIIKLGKENYKHAFNVYKHFFENNNTNAQENLLLTEGLYWIFKPMNLYIIMSFVNIIESKLGFALANSVVYKLVLSEFRNKDIQTTIQTMNRVFGNTDDPNVWLNRIKVLNEDDDTIHSTYLQEFFNEIEYELEFNKDENQIAEIIKAIQTLKTVNFDLEKLIRKPQGIQIQESNKILKSYINSLVESILKI